MGKDLPKKSTAKDSRHTSDLPLLRIAIMIKSKSTTDTNGKSSANTYQLTSITTNKPVMSRCLLSIAIASSLLLVGCGEDNDNVTSSGSATSVESIRSFSITQINTQFGLNDTATPEAKCGIKIEKVNYPTVGAAGERTNATAALMLPSGNDADCQGDRPILLYAHGTTTDKDYDFSQVANPQNPAVGESTLIAANFAAQGYIVVAPNYAGYDDSDLDYHPYLVADQQAADMADALDSARTIIARQQQANDAGYTNIDDSGKLFISGYSQGGHVAMATARMLEQKNEPVTAIAPSSGPYALAAFGDYIFSGNVNLGATRFAPLLATGLQKKYSKIYSSPNEIFTTSYANTQLPSLLSFDELVAANQLPKFALFQAKPTGNTVLDQLPASNLPFAFLGFSPDNYLIKTDFRTAYVADAIKNPDGLTSTTPTGIPAATPENELRKALKDNDLRGYIPSMPTLLCGGHRDPTVYYDLNTGAMTAQLQQENLNITVLDVDNEKEAARGIPTLLPLSNSALANPWLMNNTINNIQTQFNTSVAVTGPSFLSSYHGGLVSTACTQATREFFEQNFNQSNNPT